MKTFFSCLFGAAVLFGISSCANGKKIQEKAPVASQDAYYTTSEAGTKKGSAGVVLYIPVEAGDDLNVELDSVYFRGKSTQLVRQPDNPELYVGYFEVPEAQGESEDFVMSSDPKEEYGNRPPAVLKDFPFDLKYDEAMVSFKKDGETGYYKISGIVKKDSAKGKLNYPENIQH